MDTSLPKRVLHVVSAMNRGGTETLLMNLYRNIDRSKVQFDFVSHRREKCDYDDEIESMGGRIFRIASLGQSNPITYIRKLRQIIKSNQYAAIHSHTDYQSGFPALAAKVTGIQRRICHSHSNLWIKRTNLKETIILAILQKLIHYTATDFCACSKEAASFLFGEKEVINGNVRILKNGIEVNKFTDYISNEEYNLNLKKELCIPNEAKIIGHIGSISQIKNQAFILKIIKQMQMRRQSFYAVFVGDGPLRASIEEAAKSLGISDNVRFLGVREDISQLMPAFDVFLFPSLYEGFGLVTIEAQCSGTPCVISNTVPKSTDMGLGLVSYVSLQESLEIWCEKINEALLIERPSKYTAAQKISENGYNIQGNVIDWLKLYGVS